MTSAAQADGPLAAWGHIGSLWPQVQQKPVDTTRRLLRGLLCADRRSDAAARGLSSPAMMLFKRLFHRQGQSRLQVLMVCTGNICRSPIAEGVLRAKLQQAGLADQVLVDSAGTHGFHKGTAADPRAVAQAGLRGYRLAGLKSRPVVDADFSRFDLLLAMDRSNLATLRERCPAAEQHRLQLLLPFVAQATGQALAPGSQDVPDPYFGSMQGFDEVLDLVEPACDGLVQDIARRLASAP